MEKEILKIKKQLEEAGIDAKNLVYMPEVPMIGIDKSYVIEEHFGLKVGRLLSAPNN